MENEIKLEFLKRILIDSVDSITYDNFFSYGYPSVEKMKDCIDSPIDYKREEGLDWPKRAHTMIGLKRLNNLQSMLDYVRIKKIDGDLIETGVWRGGATIFMKAYLNFYQMDKKVFVCDSFEGLPKPNVEKYPHDYGDKHHTVDFLSIPLDVVLENFNSYGLLDDSVIFIKGWFSDTLPNNNLINKISLLRFDGDMYGSTIDVLNSLYDKVSDSGVIIIDDYCLSNCAKAVSDFRESRQIIKTLNRIDKCGVFWIK